MTYMSWNDCLLVKILQTRKTCIDIEILVYGSGQIEPQDSYIDRTETFAEKSISSTQILVKLYLVKLYLVIL